MQTGYTSSCRYVRTAARSTGTASATALELRRGETRRRLARDLVRAVQLAILSLVVTPGRVPASSSVRRTHRRSVSGGHPILGAMATTAPQRPVRRRLLEHRAERPLPDPGRMLALPSHGSILMTSGASGHPGATRCLRTERPEGHGIEHREHRDGHRAEGECRGDAQRSERRTTQAADELADRVGGRGAERARGSGDHHRGPERKRPVSSTRVDDGAGIADEPERLQRGEAEHGQQNHGPHAARRISLAPRRLPSRSLLHRGLPRLGSCRSTTAAYSAASSACELWRSGSGDFHGRARQEVKSRHDRLAREGGLRTRRGRESSPSDRTPARDGQARRREGARRRQGAQRQRAQAPHRGVRAVEEPMSTPHRASKDSMSQIV